LNPALCADETVHRTFSNRDLRIVIPLIGPYLASLLTNNQHNDSKQKLILQQGELILQPDQNYKKKIN
jgi:ArsR family metal-binding transcriptional regulator